MSQADYLPANLEQDNATFSEDIRRFLSGDLAPDVLKARRVPRGIYEQRTSNTFMVRVRLPGGLISPEQARALARVSREYASNVLHVTTRQDIQLHDVAMADVPAISRRLLEAGLSSKGGGGNTVRNVTACPFAGVCPHERFDVTPYAVAVTRYLLTLEESFTLPRKFKAAFSGCGADCAFAAANDLGFVAEVRDGVAGFVVLAGGGMGNSSRFAVRMPEFLPVVDTVRAAEAVRRIFAQMGDRKNRHRARLRFAVERMGEDAFRKRFGDELQSVRQDRTVPDAPPVSVLPAVAGVPQPSGPPRPRLADGLTAYPEQRSDLVAVRLFLPLGDIAADDLAGLGDLAECYSRERAFRTTQDQGILLRSVARTDVSRLAVDLLSRPSVATAFEPIHAFVACAGASTCKLGLCLSRGAASACAKALGQANLALSVLQSVDIRVSGCPNSCGQHLLGAVGLYGVAQRSEGRLVPSYRVLLGARRGVDAPRFGAEVGTVPARALPSFLASVLRDFAANRHSGEGLADYVERRTVSYFETLREPYSRIPTYQEAPEFYRDWGKTTEFSLAGRGPGECGAGVLDVIEGELRTARELLNQYVQGTAAPGLLRLALMATLRALLITRGVDTLDSERIIRAFQLHFVATGLVPDTFGGLLDRALDCAHGSDDALNDEYPGIRALFEHVERLYKSMDAQLQFPAPSGPAVPAAVVPTPAPQTRRDLDLHGVGCPMNFVKAKLAMEALPASALLCVTLDSGDPVNNVPASFRNEGYTVEGVTDAGDGTWRVLIRNKS